MTRDLWYVSLLHFAAPLADPAAVVAWCDERREIPLGTVELPTAEIVRWWYTGHGVRAEVLHGTALGGVNGVNSPVPVHTGCGQS